MAKLLKLSNLKKTIYYLKKNGLRKAYYAATERASSERKDDYHYEPLPDSVLKEQAGKASEFSTRFSILVPAFETREEFLRAMIDSVLAQTCGNWELILADASKTNRVSEVVGEYDDARIHYHRLKENLGISGNTNEGLKYATGEYVALLDHDDLLTEDALFECASAIETCREKNIELCMLYSDEDKCNSNGTSFYEVNRKPKFNLDLILSNNYICHLLVMQRKLMQELRFRSSVDGAQDHDIILRAVDRMMGVDRRAAGKAELPIAHIPKVLYHWRCYEGSTSENPESKCYAYEAGKRAVEDFLKAREYRANVVHTCHLGFFRVNYQPDLLSNRPDVAVVGGKLIDRHNRVAGGIYGENKEPLYLGLHKEYSGYMHRASCQQEAYAVDVRCMVCSEEAQKVLTELTGLPYVRHAHTGYFFYQDVLKKDTDYEELSLKFCEELRRRGKRIVWDPEMVQRVDGR